MSIDAVGRVAGRINEIASRFEAPVSGISDFRSLLSAASDAVSVPGSDVPVNAAPTVLSGPVTLGQMLGVAPTAPMVTYGPGAFPVAGVDPQSVTNSFGFHWGEHKHAGVDIFAERGTDILAPVGGEIEIANHAPIGGNRIWLRGDNGRGYYLAHLEGFADGIVPGTRVEAGDVVGFVGTTGDAHDTPPHLHFAISSNADLKPGDSEDPAAAGWIDPGAFLGIAASTAYGDG